MLQNIFACCIVYDVIEYIATYNTCFGIFFLLHVTCVLTGRVDIIFVKVYRYSAEGFLAKI